MTSIENSECFSENCFLRNRIKNHLDSEIFNFYGYRVFLFSWWWLFDFLNFIKRDQEHSFKKVCDRLDLEILA